jgi:hypothetical protein
VPLKWRICNITESANGKKKFECLHDFLVSGCGTSDAHFAHVPRDDRAHTQLKSRIPIPTHDPWAMDPSFNLYHCLQNWSCVFWEKGLRVSSDFQTVSERKQTGWRSHPSDTGYAIHKTIFCASEFCLQVCMQTLIISSPKKWRANERRPNKISQKKNENTIFSSGDREKILPENTCFFSPTLVLQIVISPKP